MSISVNGSAVVSGTYDGSFISGVMAIGAWNDAGYEENHTNAPMRNLRIYNRAKTDAQLIGLTA